MLRCLVEFDQQKSTVFFCVLFCYNRGLPNKKNLLVIKTKSYDFRSFCFVRFVYKKILWTKFTSQLEHDVKLMKMNKLTDCGGGFISFKVMVI